MPKPFRWSIAKREQLGTHANAPLVPPEGWFLDELRKTAARVLALSGGADLAFIGRTPENFFDYLSGAFEGMEAAPRLHLVQFSLRWVRDDDTTTLGDGNMAALGAYFDEEGVGPAAIAAGARPLALVDLVSGGGTMKSLVRVLHVLAQQGQVDWNAVQRRLRIIGLTFRTKNSPNTWRWQQRQDWLDLIPDAQIKNVSASAAFLRHIGDDQAKVTHSFQAARWQELDEGPGFVAPAQSSAIAHAAFLYDLGRSRDERDALAARLAKMPEMRNAATRALVTALRRRA